MKKLSIIVHTSLQQSLADALRQLQLPNIMFTHIEEHSSQLMHDVFLSARDKVVGYVPQVKVEVILQEAEVTPLLASLRNNTTEFVGKGHYWLTDVIENGDL